MRCLVTGCAGFIGSQLVGRLLSAGHEVVGLDNFSTGLMSFVKPYSEQANFQLIQADLLNIQRLHSAMEGIDIVFHLAANADVRHGTEHPHKDLEQNTIITCHVLDAMRQHGVKKIVFSSTGSIYGEAAVIPTPEDAPLPIQTSLYGASKIAAEGFIQAYVEGFDMQAYIFRFVSILGENYTHGHVVDFYRQLKENPDQLRVLGNGLQRKSYLYVQDCIDAIFLALEKAQDKVNIFNLGTNEYCTVNDSIGWITQAMGLHPTLTYTGGDRGWIGDNPFIFLDCQKIRALGWIPKHSIKESVIKTVDYLASQQPSAKVRVA